MGSCRDLGTCEFYIQFLLLLLRSRCAPIVNCIKLIHQHTIVFLSTILLFTISNFIYQSMNFLNLNFLQSYIIHAFNLHKDLMVQFPVLFRTALKEIEIVYFYLLLSSYFGSLQKLAGVCHCRVRKI